MISQRPTGARITRVVALVFATLCAVFGMEGETPGAHLDESDAPAGPPGDVKSSAPAALPMPQAEWYEGLEGLEELGLSQEDLVSEPLSGPGWNKHAKSQQLIKRLSAEEASFDLNVQQEVACAVEGSPNMIFAPEEAQYVLERIHEQKCIQRSWWGYNKHKWLTQMDFIAPPGSFAEDSKSTNNEALVYAYAMDSKYANSRPEYMDFVTGKVQGKTMELMTWTYVFVEKKGNFERDEHGNFKSDAVMRGRIMRVEPLNNSSDDVPPLKDPEDVPPAPIISPWIYIVETENSQKALSLSRNQLQPYLQAAYEELDRLNEQRAERLRSLIIGD